jgi:hypothetical protein
VKIDKKCKCILDCGKLGVLYNFEINCTCEKWCHKSAQICNPRQNLYVAPVHSLITFFLRAD